MTEPSGRLAELTSALSVATDLGTGQPMSHGLRTCWLSLKAAEALGLDAATRSSVFYVALLRFIGCTSDASDTAVLAGGDDIALNAAMAPVMLAGTGEAMRQFVRHLAEDQPLPRRVGRIVNALGDGGGDKRSLSQHCEAAARLATRMHLDAPTCDALAHAYERWDGKGYPDGLAGDDVPVAIRIVAVARDVEMLTRVRGWDAASGALRRRRGHGYAPAVAEVLAAEGRGWLDEIGDEPLAQVLAAEPEPVRLVGPDTIDEALRAIGDFADLKSVYTRGHSSGVAALAESAGVVLGLPDASVLRRAALVHDIGRVGVPSGIWDRRGPLTTDQWERVRLHPYLTDRVLRRSPLLEPLAQVASSHHERVDGSGYHRNTGGDQLDIASRVLAAADVFHAVCEERPHRPALTRAEAASIVRSEADAGRFRLAEVDAVIAAAGEPGRPARIGRPADLTEREVDVLRLLARGQSNKAIATTLGISPKTVGHHVEHIYGKASVNTRAGATLFAMESGLLEVG